MSESHAVIETERAPNYRLCAACFVSADLVEIRIGHAIPAEKFATSQVVVLCGAHRRELMRVLAEVTP